MKILKSNKGFTLLEVIISIAMIATIALPLLSVFVQSIKTDTAAKDVLNANYISQDYIERLDADTYASALVNLPSYALSGDYYLSASITPYGTTNGMFDQSCDYVHLICYPNENMLAVMPDGQWHIFSSLPNDMALVIANGDYTFTASGTVISGRIEHYNCAVIMNAMEKVSSSTSTITLDDNCQAVLYCRTTATSDITMVGSSETYTDMITGDTSLIHVKTFVYDSVVGSDVIATAESYINIKNW